MPKTDISVREIIDKVEHGELTLPEMQRRYVWRGTRVRDLLDSLYRNYPSGTILVWETEEEIVTRELAVSATKMPTSSQRLLLLDGQQRITSLSAILTGKPVQVRNRKRPIEILFNLEHPEGLYSTVLTDEESDSSSDENGENDADENDDDESNERDIQEELKKRAFVVASRALLNDPTWVPVSDIFTKDFSDILEKVGITSLQDPRYKKYSQRLQQVKNIENYQYVMQRLTHDLSYEEVTEIFVRVNSLGIKLRGSDLALAQITSRWKGFIDLIEQFAAEFKHDQDYIIESGLPVRTLVVFATGQSRFRTVGKIGLDKLESSWKDAKEGLRFAINFVRGNGGIDNLAYLSSPLLLIPIAVYWVRKNNEALSTDEEKKLLRWFYNAHMRGHFSMGSSETILDADLSLLFKGKSLDDLIDHLLLHVKKFTVDSSDLNSKGIRSSFFSMLYFVLRHNGAKDWWSGLKLSDQHTGNAHKIQYHHIFPKALLKNTYERKEINEIANIAFIGGKTNRRITDKEPINYLEKEVIPKRGEEALTSQLIPLDKSQWVVSNFREFLGNRRELIANEINNFMQRFE